MLSMPEGLSEKGRTAYEVVMKFLKEHGYTDTGGCKAFCSPKEWEERLESFGKDSELVIVHDGGDLAKIFNLDYMNYGLNEGIRKALEEHDLYCVQCTSWYSAVHQSPKQEFLGDRKKAGAGV